MWILSLAKLSGWSLASLGCAALSLLCPFASASRVTNLADVECGSEPPRRFMYGKIVGGANVDIEAFPHAVSIKKRDLGEWKIYCGGSLVRPYFP